MRYGPGSPWERHNDNGGPVKRVNSAIKDATVTRVHYDIHDRLQPHLQDFIEAYNFARRPKTLKGLTPCEFICKSWISEPDRFIIDPIHQMPGPNMLNILVLETVAPVLDLKAGIRGHPPHSADTPPS